MGGVAYLSLEDNEVRHTPKCQKPHQAFSFTHFCLFFPPAPENVQLGTICGRY